MMNTKKLTAAVLAAALTASLGGALPSHALYLDDPYKGVYIDRGEAQQKLDYQPMKMYSTAASQTVEGVELPDQYDPRGHKNMTAVKNQGEYGTCWSFSAMASIESSLIDYDPYIDLSEWHLAYYTYADGIGFPFLSSWDDWYNQGGSAETCNAPLISGIGPMDEADARYGDLNIENSTKAASEVRAEADYRVTDVTYYPYTVGEPEFEAQMNAIKLAVQGGQELSISYLDADSAHNEEYSSYYLPADDEDLFWEAGGHAVNIVGWNDNFPAEHFVYQPPSDGAWLVKNSWGSEFGEDGYYWISYCDSYIFDVTAYTAVSAELYDTIYQHDLFGYGATLYQDYLYFENAATVPSETAMMANVFTAESDTDLAAVMFATAMADENYEITVYTGLTDPADPTSGTAHPVTAGTMVQMGYHTVGLDEPVPLIAGERFSVVVKLSGAEGYHLTGEVCSFGEHLGSDGSTIESGMTAASEAQLGDIAENQSFISLDGIVWEDTIQFRETVEEEAEFTPEELDPDYEWIVYYPTKTTNMYGNVCIKALTHNPDRVEFSTYADELAVGESIALSSPDGRKIYYSVNDGETQEYTDMITFTGDMTIRAWTEGSDRIYTEEYAQKKAVISQLEISEGTEEEYQYFMNVNFTENNGRFEGEFGYYYIPGYPAPELLAIRPSGTSEIICNGQQLVNHEVNIVPVNLDDPANALVFTVSQDGMKSTEYVVSLVKEEAYNNGDADGNGVVNAEDAALILIYAAQVAVEGEPEEPDYDFLDRCDVVYDGEVNALDAAEVLIRAAIEGAGE